MYNQCYACWKSSSCPVMPRVLLAGSSLHVVVSFGLWTHTYQVSAENNVMSGTVSAYQALFLLTERICTEALKGHRQLWIHFSVFYRLRRPVGRMTVTEQRLEGEFRFVNSRLITNRWGHSLFAVYNRTCDWQTTCIVLSERHCDRCLGAWPSLDAMFSYIGWLIIR